MTDRKYQVMEGAPVTTAAGALVVLPVGNAEVHRTDDGYSITVAGLEPITVSPGEFDRLLVEGQVHGLPAGWNVIVSG